jgi:hypothetical protein
MSLKKAAESINISPLINIKKAPKVIMVIGNVRTIKIGLITVLIIPTTKEKNTAVLRSLIYNNPVHLLTKYAARL